MKTTNTPISRRDLLALLTAATGIQFLPTAAAAAAAVEFDDDIAPQPFFASVMRAVKALADAGQPIAKNDADHLETLATKNDAAAVVAAEKILNRYTLARVTLDKEGMGTTVLGGAERTLLEQGWKSFLVRVSNPYAVTEKLDAAAGNGLLVGFDVNLMRQLGNVPNKVPGVEKSWLKGQMQPGPALSGASVEYRVIELFSRDRGSRKAPMGFGAGTMLLAKVPRAYWASAQRAFLVDFEALPSRDVALHILDSDGAGCVASLLIRDAQQHVYPPQVMRLAPDMSFQPQIYRADGESVRLPDGEYQILARRGPEYLVDRQSVRVSGESASITVQLERWIDPAKWGWYSGDTHLHPSGCAHYIYPTEGVAPETMVRHVRGEGLSIGEVLIWNGGRDYQRQFFSGGAISPEAGLENLDLQIANNTTLKPRPTPKDRETLIRYDVEVAGFPSSMSGHAILLRLKEQDYPGTRQVEEWPSWNLPIFKWAKAQGAVVGYAHSSAGMVVNSKELPNYEIPPFDSIGMNEAIVDVCHDACDFLSGCSGPTVAALNAWYHLLNCGYTVVMVGETDYPCFTPSIDSRPGIGRSYVKLDDRPTDDAGYDAWIHALRDGHQYWGDGRSHFLTFAVNGQESGKQPLPLKRSGHITVTAMIAAMLEATPSPETIMNAAEEPWHIEHARIGNTRSVLIELIVNGVAVDQQEFVADGKPRDVRFRAKIERSSWVALRVLGSGHTYPTFVTVGGKPVRASRRSAEWLRKCVDALWQEKHRLIRDSERAAAAEAYDHARRTYDRIIAESDVA